MHTNTHPTQKLTNNKGNTERVKQRPIYSHRFGSAHILRLLPSINRYFIHFLPEKKQPNQQQPNYKEWFWSAVRHVIYNNLVAANACTRTPEHTYVHTQKKQHQKFSTASESAFNLMIITASRFPSHIIHAIKHRVHTLASAHFFCFNSNETNLMTNSGNEHTNAFILCAFFPSSCFVCACVRMPFFRHGV